MFYGRADKRLIFSEKSNLWFVSINVDCGMAWRVLKKSLCFRGMRREAKRNLSHRLHLCLETTCRKCEVPSLKVNALPPHWRHERHHHHFLSALHRSWLAGWKNHVFDRSVGRNWIPRINSVCSGCCRGDDMWSFTLKKTLCCLFVSASCICSASLIRFYSWQH